MDSTPPHLPDNANLILGPPIVGVALNWWLYGIFVVQYSYDPQTHSLPSAVHILFILDTAQSIMIMSDISFCLDGPLLDAVITFMVQIVYCWRLRVIGKWKILPVISALLALLSCVSGMLDEIDPSHLRSAVYVWLFAGAITDILIASSMAYMLIQYRAARSNPSTMAIIKRILILILETNALTAAVAIGLLTAFLVPSITPPVKPLYKSIFSGFADIGSLLTENQHLHCARVHSWEDVQQLLYGASQPAYLLRATQAGTTSQGHDGLYIHNQPVGQVSIIRFTEMRTDNEPTDIELGEIQGTKGPRDLKSDAV
ncbi:hypothetical protein NP233_g4897 [Leucocoprinus birnbaumii]|uniref:DUF6534 domain-containing protein n=1 Tax=Leucocoprinus birnbaumii TaxID=56174 RepID=A0AAD5VTY0_9AGAR|nr:hypothetical protein NP233_g4897 [Leucocoprinus birnbaumii]